MDRAKAKPGWVTLSLLLILISGCDPHDGDRDSAPVEAPAPADEPRPSDIRIVRGPALSDSLLSEQARKLPPSGSDTPPGLERKEWTMAEYGNPAQLLALRLNASADARQEGPLRLALELFGGPACSTALCLEGEWSLSVAGDAETVLVIYNSSPAAMQGGLAYTLSPSYLWYESRPFVLKPGWNTIRIRQGSGDFKTQSSDWQHTAGLWRPEDCRSITILLYNGRRTGRIFIDHIGLTETPQGATAPRRSVLQPPK